MTGGEPPRDPGAAEAALRLQEAVWRDPSNPYAHAALGVELLRLGHAASAYEAFVKAHYLQPDNPHILCQCGDALRGCGRLAEARLRYEAALRLNSRLEAALAGLSELGGAAAGPGPASWSPAPPARPLSPEPSPSPGLVPMPDPRLRPVSGPVPAAPGVSPALPPGLQVETIWEAAGVPIFLECAQRTLEVWLQQPLLWIILLGVPNALAAIYAPRALYPWLGSLSWVLALAAAAHPAVLGAAGQALFNRPYAAGGDRSPGRLLSGMALSVPYVLITVGTVHVLLGMRLTFPAEITLPAALLMTAPFHALFAPALVLASTGGASGFAAVSGAMSRAGKQTWWHLAVLLVFGAVLAVPIALLSYEFTAQLIKAGELPYRLCQVIALAVVESLWTTTIAVAGVDALHGLTGAADPDDEGEEDLPDAGTRGAPPIPARP